MHECIMIITYNMLMSTLISHVEMIELKREEGMHVVKEP